MGKLLELWLWENEEPLPRCGTPSCPLFGADDDPPEVREANFRNCPCQSEEYKDLTSRTPEFLSAYELYMQLGAGFGYREEEALDPDLDRFLVAHLKDELQRAEAELNKARRKKGEERDGDGYG